jgi:hypothetical protein
MTVIDTDYLIVGAGAAGMAFADALIAECDSDVVMVDRRHCPGSHWNDAYRFVRIHQASANYGVNSRVLGKDLLDQTGPNAGFYERATGVEICDYFQKVLDEVLLPSGKVRFFGMCGLRWELVERARVHVPPDRQQNRGPRTTQGSGHDLPRIVGTCDAYAVVRGRS